MTKQKVDESSFLFWVLLYYCTSSVEAFKVNASSILLNVSGYQDHEDTKPEQHV